MFNILFGIAWMSFAIGLFVLGWNIAGEIVGSIGIVLILLNFWTVARRERTLISGIGLIMASTFLLKIGGSSIVEIIALFLGGTLALFGFLRVRLSPSRKIGPISKPH